MRLADFISNGIKCCLQRLYTSNGNVSGISTNVDINVAYFGYSQSAGTMSGETLQYKCRCWSKYEFYIGKWYCYSKRICKRLRNKPSQDTDSTIIATLNNGETVTRTGISDSGWSRLNYNGQNVYAVSSYLTTDLSAPTQTETQQFMTQFIGAMMRWLRKMKLIWGRSQVIRIRIRLLLRRLKMERFLQGQVITMKLAGHVLYTMDRRYCITSYLIVK